MKIIIAIFLFLVFLYYVPLGFYFKAKVSGINVSLMELFRLRIKKIPTYLIFNWCKKLHDNQIKIDFKSIAKCYSNGIDLDNVVNGLIKAKQEKLKLSFELACEADKQKIDIKKTVINTVAHVGKEK
ncbi:flotillin-like FloA family protein [Sunxiuqinia indica]|uniref:flotillin-like FloA family protein n=1 Tax=Sunxiuqinia indica TaxID=2692584 RepID=UPI00135AB0FC|nr:flotillin-like FloA family protein [Sunxiuqinia indica]